MANRRKKDKILSLFKSKFSITLFHKPSNNDNDIFYYIIIDDTLQLRMKLVGNVIIIDEIKPLTDDYAEQSKSLISFFLNQSSYNILISKLGNIPAIDTVCNELNIPVVDDERFITIPISLYKRYIEYYHNNSTKYGFYLLAVLDDVNTEDELSIDDENEYDIGDNEQSVNADVKTPSELRKYVMDELINMSKDGICDINSSTEYSINISLPCGIDMLITTGSNIIDVSSIVLSQEASSISLLRFVQALIDKFNNILNISITTSINNQNVISLCDTLDFTIDPSYRSGIRYIKTKE